MKYKVVELTVPEYDPEKGIQFEWTDGFSIEVKKHGQDIVIRANAEGLLSLANHLVNLAQSSVPAGAHVHLDEYNSLQKGSCSLLVEKVN